MWYVHVIVADATYHKNEPLTYSASQELAIGQIVEIPLQRKLVLGIVVAAVNEPKFKAKLVSKVHAIPPLPKELLELLSWVRGYYPAPLGMTAQLFLPSSLSQKTFEPPNASRAPGSLPPLTKDQEHALDSIKSPGLHILHGETGTGKTRVYLELASRQLKQGKSSIILTPEIGLTSQLANTFRAAFGSRVVIMHSGLTEATRRQTWLWLLEQTEPVIVIGARSALFTPVAHLGLIVIDESHETSYKQDQAPYYHASTVAAKLASLHQAILVLGSATPLISDYFIAESKGRPIIRMTQTAASTEHGDPVLKVVDLKDRAEFSRSPYLSTPLIEEVKNKLQAHEQSLLFLNRRGTARVTFCEKCGWQANCPRCDLPLVYHGDKHIICCHSCSFKTVVPTDCPTCKSTDIIFRSIGTKAIASEVQRLFPEAKIMRFDSDNKKSERLDANYESVLSGEVDIIVGTQTLAKGLDLPRLGLVGIVLADTSLYFPDFSSQERTYQLISQVLGRVARGHRRGTAIIQTYSPESPLLKSILKKDWDIFYNDELAERRTFLFPPFCYLLKLSCKRASSKNAQQAAERLASQISSSNNNIRLEGPAPAFQEKVQNKFIWQLIVKAKRREYLTDIIAALPSGWSHDIDPMNLL
jgi:primosomal protein N' (replication factor Y) (superfamily II helicase)